MLYNKEVIYLIYLEKNIVDKFLPSKMTFKGYKCFVEECTIPWFSSFNVIIGRNNSGKTSFMNIIHSLCDPEFHANFSKNIDITLTYSISNHEYFDIDNLATQIYGYREYALQYFGTHFRDKEFKVQETLSPNNLGRTYIHSFEINPKELSDDRCSLRLKNDVNLNPFLNSVFRCISSERDINSEPFFSVSEQIGINPNGVGTTRYVCSILNNKNKDDSLIQDDVLNAFNEILGSDGHYRNIKIKQDNGDNWEIVLEDDYRNQYPLSKLGSGLKTILLALLNLIAIPNDYKDKNMVLAFEELENNLHPALEKRLYSFIFNYAQKNGYTIFLTTHSPIAIDLFSREKSVNFYKTEKNSNGYQIIPISSFDESIEILDELGIKASDLLQANGIIWVEGPSDRIYIKSWLNMLYPESFEEGKDYQFVYYGGRLLAHYTVCDPTDEEVDDYINVLAVNSKAFFIMDSDKSSCREHLAKRKKHIIKKLEEKHIPYWITKGREIENYLDLTKENIQLNQFDRLQEKTSFDKINFAKQHYKEADFNKYNLKDSLNLLANAIAKWNNKELPNAKR